MKRLKTEEEEGKKMTKFLEMILNAIKNMGLDRFYCLAANALIISLIICYFTKPLLQQSLL